MHAPHPHHASACTHARVVARSRVASGPRGAANGGSAMPLAPLAAAAGWGGGGALLGGSERRLATPPLAVAAGRDGALLGAQRSELAACVEGAAPNLTGGPTLPLFGLAAAAGLTDGEQQDRHGGGARQQHRDDGGAREALVRGAALVVVVVAVVRGAHLTAPRSCIATPNPNRHPVRCCNPS